MPLLLWLSRLTGPQLARLSPALAKSLGWSSVPKSASQLAQKLGGSIRTAGNRSSILALVKQAAMTAGIMITANEAVEWFGDKFNGDDDAEGNFYADYVAAAREVFEETNEYIAGNTGDGKAGTIHGDSAEEFKTTLKHMARVHEVIRMKNLLGGWEVIDAIRRLPSMEEDLIKLARVTEQRNLLGR